MIKSFNPLRLKRLILLLFTLPLLNPCGEAHGGVRESCAQWLVNKKQRVVEDFRQFRREVKGDSELGIPAQGLRRYLLAPRLEGRRFNTRAALLDPVVDFPAEVISFLRWRVFRRTPLAHRLTLVPAFVLGALGWNMIFVGIEARSEQAALAGLEQAVSADDFGAAYTSEWVINGTMSAPDALRFVRASQSAFVRDLEPLRNRIQEFQQLSLWNAEQAKVVTAVLERLKRTHTPKDMIHEKALLDLLEGDAEFIAWRKTLLPNQEFTAHLLLEPTFRLAGKSDAFWLALFFDPALRGGLSVEQGKGFASLEKIYAAHGKDLPLPTLVKLIADTLSDSNALHKKIARAQKLGLALTSDFIYRADVPLFGQAEVFHDLTGDVPLQSELDRWKLVLEDPRFHVYREAWESGRISELGVLLKAEVQMRALSQVYQIARGEGATLEPGSACRLIYGSSDGAANPLFVGLKKAGKLPTLQYRLATIYFNTFVAIAKLPTLEKVDAAFAQAVKSEDEFLRQAKQGELPETDQACEQTP